VEVLDYVFAACFSVYGGLALYKFMNLKGERKNANKG